jgi:hypothetical protein
VKPYCSSGLGHPAFFSGRPTRARVPPVPPRSHCQKGPPGRRQCATVRTATRRPRASHPGRGRPGHGRGAALRSGPGPMTPSRAVWHFHGRTPPPLFSFPLYCANDRTAQARPRPLILLSPLLSDSTRAPEPPHSSPHLDCHLRPPAAHSPSWIPAEQHHRPPLPGELLPELPIHAISCNFLTPLSLRCYRTPHPLEPPPHR